MLDLKELGKAIAAKKLMLTTYIDESINFMIHDPAQFVTNSAEVNAIWPGLLRDNPEIRTDLEDFKANAIKYFWGCQAEKLDKFFVRINHLTDGIHEVFVTNRVAKQDPKSPLNLKLAFLERMSKAISAIIVSFNDVTQTSDAHGICNTAVESLNQVVQEFTLFKRSNDPNGTLNTLTDDLDKQKKEFAELLTKLPKSKPADEEDEKQLAQLADKLSESAIDQGDDPAAGRSKVLTLQQQKLAKQKDRMRAAATRSVVLLKGRDGSSSSSPKSSLNL